MPDDHIVKIELSGIYFDLRQPRRAIPKVVMGESKYEPGMVGAMFNRWNMLIGEELGKRLDFVALLDGNYKDIDMENISPLAEPLIELFRLAFSIYEEGLINAITVISRDDKFVIVTGERRVLAYHLINKIIGGYDNVPARIVKHSNPWVQASENTARESLNAIEKARQFALLMMDLCHEEAQEMDSFESMVSPGACDRAYYAQVSALRIPYGFKNQLGNALNVRGISAFTRLNKALALPDEVWDQADKEGWSLHRIESHVNPEWSESSPMGDNSGGEGAKMGVDGYFDGNGDYQPSFDESPDSDTAYDWDGALGAKRKTGYELTDYTSDKKVYDALRRGQIDEKDRGDWYQYSKDDPDDPRIFNRETGEIIGGPQPMPSSLVPPPKRKREIVPPNSVDQDIAAAIQLRASIESALLELEKAASAMYEYRYFGGFVHLEAGYVRRTVGMVRRVRSVLPGVDDHLVDIENQLQVIVDGKDVDENSE